jgi:hypothetical protein
MTDMEQRLVQFARRTLAIMEDDEDWSGDTLENIQMAADAGQLIQGAGMFKVRPEVFPEPRPTVQCEDCDWQGNSQEVKPLRDRAERVAEGEDEPVGECPQCGAVAHWIEGKEP